jgi:hypothetical protein
MVITSSWDDGHPLDFKLLDLLEKYNLKATFYIPLTNTENQVMDRNRISEISKYHEIGGHTVNHKYLNLLNDEDAEYEIKHCKVILEDLIGQQIFAFCFPGGKFSGREIKYLTSNGYLFGRTTNILSKTLPSTNLMNTSVQTYNHTSITLLKHSVKRLNIKPVYQNSFFIPFDKNFLKLAEFNILKCIESNQIFHIWGHSWEIEKYNLWDQLEDLFKMISSDLRIKFLSNTETWKYINEKI